MSHISIKMTQHLLRIIWISISSFLVTFPCVNVINFLNNMTYSDLINFLKDTPNNTNSSCRNTRGEFNCETIGNMVIALKYFAFASIGILIIAILYEQCRKLYRKYVNDYEYEWILLAHDTRFCGHGNPYNMYSNNVLTCAYYILTFPCILMWAMSIYGICTYTSANFSFGMYLMMVGLLMSLLNYISFLIFRSRKDSGNNRRLDNVMYITNY